jgi:hypothetical protein
MELSIVTTVKVYYFAKEVLSGSPLAARKSLIGTVLILLSNSIPQRSEKTTLEGVDSAPQYRAIN